MKRSVLIIEPSEIIYKGLSDVINAGTTLTVLQQIDCVDNIDVSIACLKPDVVIANPTLFHHQKHETGNHISGLLPGVPVLALVYQYVENDVLLQYDAVIDIRDTAGKISRTITAAYSSEKQDESQDSTELSEREKDVLVLIAKGQMSKEIADNLNISVHTVISHRKNITRKTGIKSIAGLVAYALLNNLIDSSEIE
ncbi:MAG: helix-turn-helix transcriptional regulator [Muribaculaceae bacterium]|nr:helix-turn-helix transcriptional regulator [Muribaculaceae bacterium]